MRQEIRIAGFGGQGVITLGYVLAQAASIHDDNYALMTQSYGPEARGGACKADIIISDDPIDYPKTSKISCFVAMSIDAYNQFKKSVGKGSVIILEEDLVHVESNQMIPGVTYYKIPAVREAEALGNKLAANMVMLGAAQAVTESVSAEALEAAIKARFPKFADINIKALRRGMELGKTVKGEA